MAYEIAERKDEVVVKGVPSKEVRTALELLEQYRSRQRTSARDVRDTLLTAALAAGLGIAATESLAQAERLAAHRARLVGQGARSTAEIRSWLGYESESSARTWLARQRKAHRLFTVTYAGRTLVPSFQFSEDGRPRQDLQPLLDPLMSQGFDGWQLWTWLTSRSSLLSGGVPERVSVEDPRRAARAAERFASQLPHDADTQRS